METGSDFENQNELCLESGRLLFTQSCDFTIGATNFDQLPVTELPEVAFAGRSNVGKSSLINALTNHKSLARTSNTPGRTQQINFFNLGHRLMLADLSGYGYAKASKSVVAEWNDLIKLYLSGRAQLRRACLLIDSRHGIKDNDRETMKLMDTTAVSYQIVLTKCDKIKKGALEKLQARTTKEISAHVAAHPDILTTSSTKGYGIAEMRAGLAALAISG